MHDRPFEKAHQKYFYSTCKRTVAFKMKIFNFKCFFVKMLGSNSTSMLIYYCFYAVLFFFIFEIFKINKT